MRLFNNSIIWIGAFLLTSTTCYAIQDSTILDSVFTMRSSLPPAEIKLQTDTNIFIVNKGQHFPFGLPDKSYCCFILKLRATQEGSYTLCVNNTSLDTVLIYAFDTNGTKTLLYMGGNSIEYDVTRLYVWHSALVNLRPSPGYYLIAVKASAQNVNIDYQILKTATFQHRYRLLERLIYFYAGFISLIILICLSIGILFKRKALFVYIIYILGLSGWIMAHYGYLFAEIYPFIPALNKIVKQVTTLTSMLCLLHLITISFTAQLKKRWLWGFSILKSFTALLILFYLFYYAGFFGSYLPLLMNIVWNVSLLISVLFIITVLFVLAKTNRTARLFCIAISLVSLMAIYQSVSNMGWLYDYFFNEHGMLVASIMEILLLTSGIFYSLWKEKKRSEQELKAAESERTKTLEMLIIMQDEERKRIASDLHDSIGPMLAAIKINFLRMQKGSAEKSASDELMNKTENIIDESIAEIRNISHQLMPKGLSSKGLITLLSDYFANLETTHELRIYFTHNINLSLDKEVQLSLYRMISELALNAAKHSEAKTLAVSIKTMPAETIVFLKDDGKGFIKDSNNVSSLGIKNVSSRIDYLKGTMRLESLPGKGTSIEIIIPYYQPL